MFLCCFRPREVNRTTETDIATICTVFEKYRFCKRIGEGGCAEVWEAKDKRTGKIVAIKRTNNKEDSDYMAKEYAIMRTIDSEHVLNPAGIFESGKYGFMVMKKYPSTLFDDIQKKLLNARELRRVAKQIALGLKAIHDAGYVHRDIKPDNILMDNYGTCVIADFGLAEKEDSMTIRKISGTGSYIAPEVA